VPDPPKCLALRGQGGYEASAMNAQARKLSLPLLIAMCLLPATQTLIAVYWEIAPAVTYPGLKALMIVLAVALLASYRLGKSGLCELAGLKKTNALPGLVTGVLLAGGILTGYYACFAGRIEPGLIVAKVESLGLLKHYWAMAIVMSLWNSLFEEFYWRVFILSQLRSRLGSPLAICLVGAFAFGLHHIFALLPLFDWPFVGLFTLGTMAAGGVWTAMRVRGYSIWDCYVSHILADLAIFWAGHDLILRAQ